MRAGGPGDFAVILRIDRPASRSALSVFTPTGDDGVNSIFHTRSTSFHAGARRGARTVVRRQRCRCAYSSVRRVVLLAFFFLPLPLFFFFLSFFLLLFSYSSPLPCLSPLFDFF